MERVQPDAVRLDEQFAIIASRNRTSTPLRVLKHGDTFGVFDLHGDVIPADASEQGLYHDGTRFLSHFALLLGRHRPLLLSSTISEDNSILAVDLTNPDVLQGDRWLVPHGALHLFRARVLSDGVCVERIRLSNHALYRIELSLSVTFDSDFADVFEVRGTKRPRRGIRHDAECTGDSAILRYEGLDGVARRTALRWSRPADRVDAGAALFVIGLAPHETVEFEITISCEATVQTTRIQQFDQVLAERNADVHRRMQDCVVVSSNESFNKWLRRSAADLDMLITDTPSGPYPYAGIPWFSTPFGRDGIITALEVLWAAPDVARGVLTFLADTQATASSDSEDAQPGKILHETRTGEMAALGEIPFGRYYGSVDATPLFVVLAHAYFQRTADRQFIEQLWPHIVAALAWMDRHGDPNQDGFIEYARRSESGLIQQGWKDSFDSVFHDDGTLAEPPISLCEVQGYAYAAWAGAASLAEMRGAALDAEAWRARAATLQSNFERAFWCEDLGTYALALDRHGRPCRVRTTNAGHCLFSGIAGPVRASRVCEALLSDASFSGWGLRTVAAGQARYNPMSYHNGSVWPHDNAIVAAGFAQYGLTGAAARILTSLFDLSQAVDGHRLPELICGFHRRLGEHPTLYPVACAPQAWAAGSVYLLLSACLGLRVDAPARTLYLTHALLPDTLQWIRITNLVVRDARVSVLLTRHAHDVGVNVLEREGDLKIVAIK